MYGDKEDEEAFVQTQDGMLVDSHEFNEMGVGQFC